MSFSLLKKLYYYVHLNFSGILFGSYAVVEVEVKNQGEDAFKPEVYGDAIIIERRINQSTSSTVLKDFQGPNNFLLINIFNSF